MVLKKFFAPNAAGALAIVFPFISPEPPTAPAIAPVILLNNSPPKVILPPLIAVVTA